jgi:cephalosporin-C deacetylase-like acetyl esterase
MLGLVQELVQSIRGVDWLEFFCAVLALEVRGESSSVSSKTSDWIDGTRSCPGLSRTYGILEDDLLSSRVFWKAEEMLVEEMLRRERALLVVNRTR